MPRSPLDSTILVTRAAGQAGEFANLLQQAGYTVLDMPALEIHPPSQWDAVDAAIANLPHYDWLILTSANAVTYFLERVAQQNSLPKLAHLKIAVVGRKTAQILAQHGFTADFIPPDFVADALVAHFPVPLKGLTILFPRVESGGREVLVQAMTAAGAQVTEVPTYESGCPTHLPPAVVHALETRQVAIITFASSKTVRNACHLFAQTWGTEWPRHLAGVAIASIGPQTSATCHELFKRVDIEATEYTLEGLIQAIQQWVNASSV